jgi:hypothetical protein
LFVGPSLFIDAPLFVGPSLLFRLALISIVARISGLARRACLPLWSRGPWRLARGASGDK